MVDDLVTRGTGEPYRMFTSRAEYRLMLREDNADLRLAEKAFDLGLITGERLALTREIMTARDREIQRVRHCVIRPTRPVNTWLESAGSAPIATGCRLDQILKRSGLDYSVVDALDPSPEALTDRVKQQVEIELKYEGYISRQLSEIEKFRNMERIRIPEGLSYAGIPGLSSELKEKLWAVKPESLGQASRIDGMTPAAISVIMVAITAFRKTPST
jgi:tRNA uridine 5-carboxymethylaminomethyl modification enzyme